MEDAEVPEGTEVPEVEGEVESAELTTDDVEVEGAEVEDDQPRYVVKVDGVEQKVTLDELRSGYQRQADYTRKTQDVAAERERLASLARLETALNTDPIGTIEALQRIFGSQEPEAELEELDPLEKEVRELRLWREQQETEARQKKYEAEASAAAVEHGLEVSAEELLRFAVDNQIGSLKVAARLMKVDRVSEETAKRTEQVTTRKRTAAVVEGGRSRPAAAAGPAAFTSIREAYAAAKKQHGA